jgi:hypothetical protein
MESLGIQARHRRRDELLGAATPEALDEDEDPVQSRTSNQGLAGR